MSEQLNRLEEKIDKLHGVVCAYIQEAENRLTHLETVQRGFLWFFGIVSTGCIGYLFTLM